MDIIADILASANSRDAYGEGVGISCLLRKANVPYNRTVGILSDLVEADLLIREKNGKSTRYKTSDKGLEFLDAYANLTGVFNEAVRTDTESLFNFEPQSKTNDRNTIKPLMPNIFG